MFFMNVIPSDNATAWSHDMGFTLLIKLGNAKYF